MYRSLDHAKIHATIARLELRVLERFPDLGLRELAHELSTVSLDVRERVLELQRPHLGLRIAVSLLLLMVVGSLLSIPLLFRDVGAQQVKSLVSFVQVLEPALGTTVFLGAFVIYLMSRERDRKRARAFASLHELRSLAHVVDMHQLTKDPKALRVAVDTASSPVRTLTDEELVRYLDYCSEMLALVSKLSALHAEGLPDPEVIGAVDEFEALCTGLSRKIWQKLVLLGSAQGVAHGS